MTLTRHPTGQDLMCLVCLKPAQDIDHVVNRGMGGSKERDVPENKVPLCRECHQAKTAGFLETRIREARFTNRPWALFYEWRRRNSSAPWITVPVEVSKRYKCLVLSAAAEGEQSTESVIGPSVAAPSAGLGGEAATPPQVSPSPSLTHEQRVDIAQDIKDTEWNRQWFAGDIGNLWIEQLGESAEQYLSDFGYQPESLANILRVCAKIPPAYRNGNLRFSHHVVVAGENLEDMEMHLAECEEGQWSVAEFRRQRKGTKPRVKRWSEPELREAEEEFAKLGWEMPTGSEIRMFLDWLVQLGEQA